MARPPLGRHSDTSCPRCEAGKAPLVGAASSKEPLCKVNVRRGHHSEGDWQLRPVCKGCSGVSLLPEPGAPQSDAVGRLCSPSPLPLGEASFPASSLARSLETAVWIHSPSWPSSTHLHEHVQPRGCFPTSLWRTLASTRRPRVGGEESCGSHVCKFNELLSLEAKVFHPKTMFLRDAWPRLADSGKHVSLL